VEGSCEFGIEPSGSIKCWESAAGYDNGHMEMPRQRQLPRVKEKGNKSVKLKKDSGLCFVAAVVQSVQRLSTDWIDIYIYMYISKRRFPFTGRHIPEEGTLQVKFS
jgi:hypothetical protein